MIGPHHSDVCCSATRPLPRHITLQWQAGLGNDRHPATIEVVIDLSEPHSPACRARVREAGAERSLRLDHPPTARSDPAADLIHLDAPELAATIALGPSTPRLLYARSSLAERLSSPGGALEPPRLLDGC